MYVSYLIYAKCPDVNLICSFMCIYLYIVQLITDLNKLYNSPYMLLFRYYVI